MKKIFKYIILISINICIGIILALALIEIGLRISGYSTENFFEFNKITGYRFKKNLNLIEKQPEFKIKIQTNSSGFRDIGHKIEKRKKRILFLGDSFGEGYGVNMAERYDFQVQDKLSDWEIINAAIRGFGTVQEYLYLKEEGIKYDPDIVILMLFISNDISDNFSDQVDIYARPYLKKENNQFVLENYPIKKIKVDLTTKTKIKNFFRFNFVMYPFFRNLIKVSFPNITYSLGRFGIFQGTAVHKKIPEIYSNKVFIEKNKEISAMIYMLKRIKHILKNRKFYIFFIPELIQVNDKVWDKVSAKYESREFNRNMPLQVFEYISKKSGIKGINPLAEFKKKENNNINLYYRKYDMHWDKNGHKSAGEIIYNFLKENKDI